MCFECYIAVSFSQIIVQCKNILLSRMLPCSCCFTYTLSPHLHTNQSAIQVPLQSFSRWQYCSGPHCGRGSVSRVCPRPRPEVQRTLGQAPAWPDAVAPLWSGRRVAHFLLEPMPRELALLETVQPRWEMPVVALCVDAGSDPPRPETRLRALGECTAQPTHQHCVQWQWEQRLIGSEEKRAPVSERTCQFLA